MPPAIEFDQFILATFFASLFALVLVYVLRRSSRRDDADSNRSKKNRGLVQNDAVVSRNVADSGIDVIIVGAGVAGAALAHTLGKASLSIISLVIFILLSIFGNFLQHFCFSNRNLGFIYWQQCNSIYLIDDKSLRDLSEQV